MFKFKFLISIRVINLLIIIIAPLRLSLIIIRLRIINLIYKIERIINGSIKSLRDLLLVIRAFFTLISLVVKHETFAIINRFIRASNYSNKRLLFSKRSENGLLKLKAPTKNSLTIKQLSITLPALGDPLEISTFRPFVALLFPWLILSALEKEGVKALSLSSLIYEEIRKGHYEYLICSNDVRPVLHI